MATMEPMTTDRARLILKESFLIFSLPENKEHLLQAQNQVAAAPEEQRAMLKMQLYVPLVTQQLGGKLQEFGIPNVMAGMMSIQSVAAADPLIFEG